MIEKRIRQQIICRLVSKNKIANQEELQKCLLQEGINATQATISRDLKELKIIKVHNSVNGYSYCMPHPGAQPSMPVLGDSQSIDGIVSIEFSGNLAVIKTKPAYANMVGYLIDTRMGRSVMGTIAGDDTLLMILREGTNHDAILADISYFIPGIENKRL